MTGTVEAMGRIVDMLAPLPAPDLTPERLRRVVTAIRDMTPVGWLDAAAVLAEMDRASAELVDATARADRLAVALGRTKVLLDDALADRCDRDTRLFADLADEVARLEAELGPWRAVQDLRDAQLAHREARS